MTDIAIPDEENYAFGDAPIPDNFLDDTLSKAVNQHRRKESQIASVEDDFAKVLDQNVASNIAANLIGYIHDGNDESNTSNNNIARDPDEDDVRVGYDEETHDENDYGLDEMLIETVTAHKHRESRTDFVEAKLHELFPQNEDEDDGELLARAQQGGAVDMSVIASNLVSFLHDDPDPDPDPNVSETINIENSKKKARSSTDLTLLQEEIDRLQTNVINLEKQLKNTDDKNSELNDRVNQLEDKNHDLMKEIQFLQNSKTTLAMNTTQCIDDLRSILIQYQNHVKLE